MSDQDRERLGDAVRDAAAKAAGEVIGHWIARAHPDLPVLRWRAIHLDGRRVGLGNVTDVDQAVAEIRAVEVRTTTTLDGVEIQVFGYVKRGR